MDPELDPDPLLQKMLYQEPDPQLEKCCIRIRIKSMRIWNPEIWNHSVNHFEIYTVVTTL